MVIKHAASAGTLESSDCMVNVSPAENNEQTINIESIVMTTFGDQIREEVEGLLKKYEVGPVVVDISDRGAIECVIRARFTTALFRAADEKFNWEGEY